MNKKINQSLNDLLYKNEYNQTDLKIHNIINKLIEKNKFNDNYLLQNFKEQNIKREISELIEYKDYALYELPKEDDFIYCSTSFVSKYEILNYSTLNGFLGLMECLSCKNKFISVNYKNKEDKNVFLANTISNILVNHFISNYSKFLNGQQHNNKLFLKFINEEFKPPKILITGYENQEEINEICRTFFDFNNVWVGLRARIFIPSFNEIFYSININLENNEILNNSTSLESKYYLAKSNLLLNELPNNFLFAAKNAFNIDEIEWNEIPAKIYENFIISKREFPLDLKYNEEKKEHIFEPTISQKLMSYGYRHINEWIYINNWLNSKNDKFEIKNLNYLKPIITSNIEEFVELISSGIWNNNNNELEQFDYVIIDDANKISTKYLPFFLYTFKNIIALGEYVVDNKNDYNDAIKNIYKLISGRSSDVDNLLTSLNLNNQTANQSILNWINENTNIETISNKKDELNIKKGICL